MTNFITILYLVHFFDYKNKCLTNYFYFTETTNDFLHFHTMQILVLVIFASFRLVGYVSGSPRKTLVPISIGRMLISIICYRAS